MPQANDIYPKSYAYMSSLGFRICLSAAAYPFDYAKFLIQVSIRFATDLV